jgi:hypothetical protein
VQLAPTHSVRLIAVQRRDYPGSTPLQDAELAPLASGDPASVLRFFLARSIELAAFVQHVVNLGIPPLKNDGRNCVGGIALTGWSLGNLYGLSLLDHVEELPKPLAEVIKTHVKTYVAYGTPGLVRYLEHPPILAADPPDGAVGVPPISRSNPLAGLPAAFTADPTSPDYPKLLDDSADFFAGFFSYPPLTVHPDAMTEAELFERYVSVIDKPARPSSRLGEHGAALMACNVPAAGAHEAIAMIAADASGTSRASAARVLERAEPVWPGLRIEYVTIEDSVWPCKHASDWMRRSVEGAGHKMTLVQDTNHFVSSVVA